MAKNLYLNRKIQVLYGCGKNWHYYMQRWFVIKI